MQAQGDGGAWGAGRRREEEEEEEESSPRRPWATGAGRANALKHVITSGAASWARPIIAQRGTSPSAFAIGPYHGHAGLAACCATADQDHGQRRASNGRVLPRNKYSRACSCRTPLPVSHTHTHVHTRPAPLPRCLSLPPPAPLRVAERRLHAKRSGQRVTQYRRGVHIPHNFVNTRVHNSTRYTWPAASCQHLRHRSSAQSRCRHPHHTPPRPASAFPRLTSSPISGGCVTFCFHSSLALTNKEGPPANWPITP